MRKLTFGQNNVIITKEADVFSNRERSLATINVCHQEEADTRLLLHVSDCVQNGNKRLLLRTVDTYVIVIAVAMSQHMNYPKLWIAFGMGKTFSYIPIHGLAESLGPSKSRALPFFSHLHQL